MVALVLLRICVALASKWVEYKFGLEYGDSIYDYSGNSRHGTNGGLNTNYKAKMTDRGMYFAGSKSHISVPDSYSGPHLGSSFSIVIWSMPRVQDGYIFVRGPGSASNHISIYGDSSQSLIGFKNLYSSGYSTSCGDYLVGKIYLGSWTLSLVTYTSSTFKLYTQGCESTSISKYYAEIGDYYFTYLGNPYSSNPAFTGFIWYFLIIESLESISTYVDHNDYTTCTIGKCVTCSYAVIDQDYGTVCLSTVIDDTLNSFSQSCSSSSYGCSDSTLYSCSCPFTCTYNLVTDSCYCLSSAGVSSQGTCPCRTGYSAKIKICCDSQCSGCSDSSTCTGCNDANAVVNSGECGCKSGYYLSGSQSTNYCSSCLSGCKTCTTSTDCSVCFDPNSKLVNNLCVCKDGYYGTASTTTTSTCYSCGVGCSSCSSSSCLACYDTNAKITGNDCSCKSGYFGSPSTDSSVSSCYSCPSKCSECSDAIICVTCFDQNAYLSSNTCICKPGYFGEASIDENPGCLACQSKCSKCTNSNDCELCFDPNSEVINNNCYCKTGYYGSPSTDATTNCFECPVGCSACSSANDCTACFDSNSFYDSTSCKCNEGFYGTTHSSYSVACFSCTSKCKTCTDSSDCLYCFDPNAIFENGACICKPAYYGSASTDSTTGCFSCPSGCSSCMSSLVCNSCFDINSQVAGNSCVCLEGYFGTPSDGSSSGCSSCKVGCKVCTSNTDCLECFDSLAEIISNTCVCKEGFYGIVDNSGSSCSKCDDGCKTCWGVGSCYSCFGSNTEIIENQCKCKIGYFDTESNGLGCKKCESKCSECTGIGKCTSCIDSNSQVVNGKCECVSGFFEDNFICVQCLIECKTCESLDGCLTCIDPHSSPFKDLGCKCDKGYYNLSEINSETSCLSCSNTCEECENENSCSTCKSKNSIINDEGNCECLSGFYNETALIQSNSCKPCNTSCISCKDFQTCSLCAGKNTVLHNGKCECKPKFYLNKTDDIDCIACPGYTVPNKCKSFCKSHQGWISGECIDCPELCVECSSSENCIQCSSNSSLKNEMCECNQGFIYSSSSCEASYFYLSFIKYRFMTFQLRFTDDLTESLETSDLSIYIYQTLTHFELSKISESTYLMIIDKNITLNESTKVLLFINKSPLYSISNSQLHSYSANLTLYSKRITNNDVSSASQTLAGVSVGTAVASNPASCWMLINTLQMVSYLPFNSIPYTGNLQEFASSIGEYNIIPNFLAFVIDPNSSSEPYQPAKDSGFETSVFWINFGKFFTVVLVGVVMIPVFYLGLHAPLLKNFCWNILRQYKFSFFLRFWLVAYIPVGIYSIVQIHAVYFI